MKQKKSRFKIYGLKAHFAISMIISAFICILLFLGLYYSSEYLLEDYFTRSDFVEKNIKKQKNSLQKYINDNNISRGDLGKLKKWEQKQPVIYLELYEGDTCIYRSSNDLAGGYDYIADDTETPVNVTELTLSDTIVKAVLFSDFTYRYYVLRTVISIIISLILYIILFLLINGRVIRYIRRLNEEVQIIEGGNLEYEVSVRGYNEITDLAKSMNRLRESFKQQIAAEQQLHNTNKKLITEMSHDLRTPLTGIMLYLEILRTRRYSDEAELNEYLEKIDRKAKQMKVLSDHLFKYSLEKNIDKNENKEGGLQIMDLAFRKHINDMCEDLNIHGFSVVYDRLKYPFCVNVNSDHLHRIFENIASNIVKYAEPASEVRIDTLDQDEYCGFSFMNKCAETPHNDESHGIGSHSINTMMDQMNGICSAERSDNIFQLCLLFPNV